METMFLLAADSAKFGNLIIPMSPETEVFVTYTKEIIFHKCCFRLQMIRYIHHIKTLKIFYEKSPVVLPQTYILHSLTMDTNKDPMDLRFKRCDKHILADRRQGEESKN